MIVFPAEDGAIGVGCIREISDAIRCHVPVVAVDLRSGVVEFGGVDLFPLGIRSARRAGVMRLGEPVNWVGMTGVWTFSQFMVYEQSLSRDTTITTPAS